MKKLWMIALFRNPKPIRENKQQGMTRRGLYGLVA